MRIIDQYSLSTLPLEMFFNDTYLSLGTSFIMSSGEEHFLVTNWHNLSGKNPITGKHLSATLAEPNRVRVWWNVRGQIGAKQPEVVQVRGTNDEALWYVHPSHGRGIDVVALPVLPPAFADPLPINKMANQDLLIRSGMDVFVLGYPFGISSGGLPIWKKASLATEPDLAGVGDQLHMLIDTASRPGMSGSPVIRRSWGTHLFANGNNVITSSGDATKFVGVYSGRIGAQNELEAQLGMVWPANLVDEVISGRTVDPFP